VNKYYSFCNNESIGELSKHSGCNRLIKSTNILHTNCEHSHSEHSNSDHSNHELSNVCNEERIGLIKRELRVLYPQYYYRVNMFFYNSSSACQRRSL